MAGATDIAAVNVIGALATGVYTIMACNTVGGRKQCVIGYFQCRYPGIRSVTNMALTDGG